MLSHTRASCRITSEEMFITRQEISCNKSLQSSRITLLYRCLHQSITEQYLLLPNTSGARDAKEAIRLAKLARAASGINWLKLEVTPDPYYLLPDGTETLKAAEALVKDGFIVLPYINADPILAKKLHSGQPVPLLEVLLQFAGQ